MFNKTWQNIIDIESFSNWILCHDLLGTGDSGGTNMFMLRQNRDFSTKFIMPCLWDFGKSFFMKNQWSESHGSGCFVYGPLFEDDEFVAYYKENWAKKKRFLIDEIIKYINIFLTSNELKAYEECVDLNNKVWNMDLPLPSQCLNQYVGWFTNREVWLDKNINEL